MIYNFLWVHYGTQLSFKYFKQARVPQLHQLAHPINVYLPLFSFRLILTTVLLTSKFYNDVFFSNNHIAYVGGVPVLELNCLETHFLEMIDYKLFVSPEENDRYLGALELHIQEVLAMEALQAYSLQQ